MDSSEIRIYPQQNCIDITHIPTRYGLRIGNETADKDKVTVYIPTKLGYGPVPVTARPFLEYLLQSMAGINELVVLTNQRRHFSDVFKAREFPLIRYCEIGSGLGGFIPEVVSKVGTRLPQKPIVIDPCDYQLTKSLLEHVLCNFGDLDENQRNALRYRVERCNFYLDPTKVRHIQRTFNDAMKDEPSLAGSFDFVIELMSLGMYMDCMVPEAERSNLTRLEGSLIDTSKGATLILN